MSTRTQIDQVVRPMPWTGHVWLDRDVNTLADPRHCPSCRSELPLAAAPMCPTCSLDLRGPRGAELFELLTRADELIARIRAASAARESATVPTGHQATADREPLAPLAPARSAARVPTLGLGTVPKVLLSLGALCVLVAGALFLPYAWGMLGVAGRTIVLVVLTAAAAAGTWAAGTRALRATAEALGAVTFGLLALDVLGAHDSGWLGDPSTGGLTILLGVVLLLAGTGASLGVRRTQVPRLVTVELTAVIGTAMGVAGVTALTSGTAGQRLAVATACALVVAAVSSRLLAPRDRLLGSVASAGHWAVAALSWVCLFLAGLVRLEVGLTWGDLWPLGAGGELLAAGLLAAAPCLLPALTDRARELLVSLALIPWTIALTAPLYDEGAIPRVLVALGLTSLGGLVMLLLERGRTVVAPVTALAALAAAIMLAPLGAVALETTFEVSLQLWSGTVDGREPTTWDPAWGPAWLLPLGVLVLFGGATLVARARLVGAATVTLVGTALAGAGALLMSGAPVWLALAVLLSATLGTTALTWSAPSPLQAGVAVLACATLVVATYDELLSFVACTALVLIAATLHLRGRPAAAAAGGGMAAPLLSLAVWSGAYWLGWPEVWSAAAALLACTVVVIAHEVWGEVPGSLPVELGAAAAACLSVVVGVDAAPDPTRWAWLAGYLTALGVVTTSIALIRPDRRPLAWVGGLLLASASWVRLADLGVGTVEAYTLPSALVLLALGWWHTARTQDGTLSAWSPGLGLALVPSLLWSLEDPVSWRALLLALACLGLTLTGAQRRLAAPLVWGGAVGALLALWEVVPPALETSAWVVSGVAGAVLLGLGASWDRRVRDAQRAAGYVRRLR